MRTNTFTLLLLVLFTILVSASLYFFLKGFAPDSISETEFEPNNINRSALKKVPARDYQIDITDSVTYIYDGDRLVGTVAFDSTNAFDKIFLKDNE